MFKGNKLLASTLIFSVAMMSTACTITEKEEAAADQYTVASQKEGNVQSSVVGAESVSSSWAEENKLNESQSSEELYQNALQTADGEVHIYTVSGRMENVKTTFEEDYPGLTLVVHDMNINELLEKFTRE